ncbi:glycosyl transferase family 28 [Dyadobacter chenwenxiniae]|uniref:Glycosyl transferase family 28 n=1 Tax=Dyadobacter chenwenxiniae TaxID=2906456 RepID=A0A9X1PN78_9BACT|nr:glycosyltransferase [Dyadobacter chenwenxiniae]MCF0048478.1 glycosyl transferase family 28 [Dyadobacter chenwenxiniae]MCF0062673.1 glycosyl transferase family 28 [Dyadobacter chenwenxiniae]UON83582.1 glycosyl transferase family 28 [Dyadobacter chenwenxiniae]
MIFVTVGTQGPFDRLIMTMDELALSMPNIPIVAQIGASKYKVKNMNNFQFASSLEMEVFFNEAQLIVSHAGMGTIISAFERKKPIIIFPKLAKFGEHRNDHQLATAKRLESLNYLQAAYDLSSLKAKVTAALAGELDQPHNVGRYASTELITSLQTYLTV